MYNRAWQLARKTVRPDFPLGLEFLMTMRVKHCGKKLKPPSWGAFILFTEPGGWSAPASHAGDRRPGLVTLLLCSCELGWLCACRWHWWITAQIPVSYPRRKQANIIFMFKRKDKKLLAAKRSLFSECGFLALDHWLALLSFLTLVPLPSTLQRRTVWIFFRGDVYSSWTYSNKHLE